MTSTLPHACELLQSWLGIIFSLLICKHTKFLELILNMQGTRSLLCRLMVVVVTVLLPQLSSAKGQCTARSPVEFRDGEQAGFEFGFELICLLSNRSEAHRCLQPVAMGLSCCSPCPCSPFLWAVPWTHHSAAGHRGLPVDQGHRLRSDHRCRHQALLPIATHGRRQR